MLIRPSVELKQKRANGIRKFWAALRADPEKYRAFFIKRKKKVYKNDVCKHFDRPYRAKGLCYSCYMKKYYATNPEYSTERKTYSREYGKTHRKPYNRRQTITTSP